MLAVVIAERRDPEGTCQKRKFTTTDSGLRALREWLQEQGVREVAMESTAQYWKPVWLELEGHWVLRLAQARSTAGPRGRKRDFADALRIGKRLLAGDLTLSYVPEAEQRRWRLLARTRRQLLEDRVRMRNQVECLLEESRIKLSSFGSDLLGVTSRRILQALAKGVPDGGALAKEAAEYLHASEEQLRDALARSGEMHPTHRQLLQMFLERIESLDQHLAMLERELGLARSAHQEAVERLCAIPGVNVMAAEQAIAEVGPEAKAFPSPEQRASWIGVCPGREESA